MIVLGYDISKHTIIEAEAWCATHAAGGFTAGEFEEWINARLTFEQRAKGIANRLVDRLIQRQRRARVIRLQSKRWYPVEPRERPSSIRRSQNMPQKDNRRARVTRISPADRTNQVLSLVGGANATYRRSGCSGCPWRVDQTGTFPAEAFRISASTSYDGAFEMFACHEAGAAKPVTCAGFLLQNSVNNIGARIKGIAGGADCCSDVELFPSYREMAIANGVASDDPALARCRADNEIGHLP